MRWTTSSHHRDFFQKQKLIQFEDLLPSHRIASLIASSRQQLSKRLQLPVEELDSKAPEEIYAHGRDLFRSDRLIKKEVCNPHLAGIAAELTGTPALRIAYDQLFATSRSPTHAETQLIQEQRPSLINSSCIQGIVCGLFLCLSRAPSADAHEETLSLLPKHPGSGVFFHPSLSLPFDQLHGLEDALYLLIVYTAPISLYLLQPGDIHTHALKQLGYVFGDRLIEKHHPTVYDRKTAL